MNINWVQLYFALQIIIPAVILCGFGLLYLAVWLGTRPRKKR